MKKLSQLLENRYVKSIDELESLVNSKINESIQSVNIPDDLIKTSQLQHIERIILVGKLDLESIHMLGEQENIVVEYLNVEDFEYTLDNEVITITSEKKTFTVSKDDALNTIILVRSGYTKQNSAGCLKALESIGITLLNGVEPVALSSDKFATAELLNRYKISQPKYCLITTEDVGKKNTKPAEKKLAKLTENANDDTQYVCKILNGHGGRGVFICRKSNIISILQCIFAIDDKCPILVQEYCELKEGDIRVHVISLNGQQKIVDSIIRLKGDSDFRTNLSLGNKMDAYKLTPEQETLALNAAKVSGLIWCGVDIMPLKNGGNMIAEFNGAPGPASNIDDKDLETTNCKFFKKIFDTINGLCKQ